MLLLLGFFHQPNTSLTFCRISSLRIKAFQFLERTTCLDFNLIVDRNDCCCIAIEVCARQTFCNLRVDTNCIDRITQCFLSSGVLIVNDQLWDLECSTMRIANQHNAFAILIIRSIDLIVFEFVDRQEDLILLSRKSSSLQMYSGRVTRVCKIEKKLSLNRRIRIIHDFLILIIKISISKIKLSLNQRHRLFGKKLGRQVDRLILPIPFFFQFINRGEMFFTIFPDVMRLTISFDGCTKRIVGIILNLLKHVHLTFVGALVGIKDNVIAFRNIIRIHCHAFQIMASIDHDTNLSIMGLPEIQVFYTRTNLDDTIFRCTTLITIVDLDSIGCNACRILTLEVIESAIFRMVILYLLNIITICICVTDRCSRLTKNFDRCLFTRVCYLRDTYTVNFISFKLQHGKRLIQLARRNAKFSLNASTDIQIGFGLKFFFQNFGSADGLIRTSTNFLIQQSTNR